MRARWSISPLTLTSCALLAWLIGISTAAAQTFDGGAVGDLWASDENWDTDSEPTSSGNVIIPDGLSATVAQSEFAGTVLVESGAVLSVLASATNVSALLTVSGDFTNDGNTALDSVSNGTATIDAVNFLNRATGTLVFDTGGTSNIRRLQAALKNSGHLEVRSGVAASLAELGGAHEIGGTFQNDGDFSVTGSSQSVTFTGSVTNNGSIELTSVATTWGVDASLGGSEAIQINSGSLAIAAGAIGSAAFRVSGSPSISGDLASDQTVVLTAGTNVSTTLSADSSFSNAGSIELTNEGSNGSSRLLLGTGETLTNEATGVILFRASGSVPNRTLSGNLTNRGAVTIESGVTGLFNTTSGLYINEGAFSIDGSLSFSGQNQIFRQSAGTLDIPGSFSITSGTFEFDGGALSGNRVVLTSSRLAIGAGSTGAGTFDLLGNSNELAGDVAADQEIRIRGTVNTTARVVADGSFSNAGLIELTNSGSNGGAILDLPAGTTLINPSGSTLAFRAGGSNPNRDLTGSLINEGSVIIESGVISAFNETNGTYENRATFDLSGTLNISGSGETFRQTDGILDISGNLNVSNGAILDFDGGTITTNRPLLSNARLEIAEGNDGAAHFEFIGNSNTLGGDIASTQSVQLRGTVNTTAVIDADGSFENAGTIELMNSGSNGGALLDLPPAATLTNAAGALLAFRTGGSNPTRNLTGSLHNEGTILIESGASTAFDEDDGLYENQSTFTLAGSLTIDESGETFRQSGGTLANTGTFAVNSGATLDFTGGDITGNAVQLTNARLQIGNSSTGTGDFLFFGSNNTVSGDIAADQSITVQGTVNTTADIDADAAFSNHGLLVFKNSGSNGATRIDLPDGQAVTNTADGSIEFIAGGNNPARTLGAALINEGTVTVETHADLHFDQPGEILENRASFNLDGQLFVAGSSQTFRQTSGTLAIGQGLAVSGGTARFEFDGGNITGAPVSFSNATLAVGNGSNGTGGFDFVGSSNGLEGDIGTGQELVIRGTVNTEGVVTANTSFANRGSLRLQAESNIGSRITVSGGGSLTNEATGSIALETGGTSPVRTIQAELDNAGSLIVEAGVSGLLDQASASHRNSGDIAIDGTLAVLHATSSFTNESTGTISGTGELDVTATGAFTNAGTLAPGASPGKLTIDGDLLSETSALLEIEIGGFSQGVDYDWLHVTGDAQLDGDLSVILLPAVMGSLDGTEDFTIVTAGNSLSGGFANLAAGSGTTRGGGYTFDVTVGANTLSLVNFQATPIPEPSLAMAIIGLFAAAWTWRRRRPR